MENIIVTINFGRQSHQVLLHEQMENGATINNNLNTNQEDQQFVHLEEFLNLNRNIHGQKKDFHVIKHLK